MKYIKNIALLLIVIIIILSAFPVCNNHAGKTDFYASWDTLSMENIKIIYPARHLHKEQIATMAQGYITSIVYVCNFLDADIPSDTLIVYYYTGYGQGQEVTGKPFPFAEDTIIHFWLPSYLGVTMMQYLLPKIFPDGNHNEFLRHGLIALFDYSGNKYNHGTLHKHREKELTPLAVLAFDSTINSDKERIKSGPVASFVNFYINVFGVQAFKDLYTTGMSFDKYIESNLKMSVDSLQSVWLYYLENSISEEAYMDFITPK